MKDWPAGGPPLLWKAAGLGVGYSSLAIVGQRIFTIGETNGTLVAGTWDFAVFNSVRRATHVNESRWLAEHDTIAECPYTHFTADLRATYFALLEAKDGTRTGDCRGPSRDINGTLSGGWFQDDSNDMHPPWLEIASDGPGLVEARILRTDGSVFNLRQYRPTMLPDEVHVGGHVCYADGQSFLWLTLVDADDARLVEGSGPCPSTEPAGGAAWQR